MAEKCDWQEKSDFTDGQASHTQGDIQLRNATLHFLRPNTTAHIQPLDAGIVKSSNQGFQGTL